jgi:2-methylisocitrate lyase-like PEP mutase family enzyme
MNTRVRPGDALADQLNDGLVFAPGCYDCLSAAVLEGEGAPAIFVSGAGIAASSAGLPDLGLTSLTELLTSAGNIIARSAVPIIVDGDNGFGNELNTARTVEAIGRLGAAAVMIEDQVFPKRCGHLEQKAIVSRDEYERKLRVALDICDEFGMLLIARTDSLAVEGIEESAARVELAHDLGAHITFVDAPRDQSDVERIGGLPGMKMYNIATGSSTPSLPFRDLHDMGFNLVIEPCVSLYPAIDGIRRAYRSVVDAGSAAPLKSFGMKPRDIFESVGLNSWLEIDGAASRSARSGR